MTSITSSHGHYPQGYTQAYDPGYDEPGMETVYVPPAPTGLVAGKARRSLWLPVPFIVPTVLCALSWLAGGIQVLTDLGFTLLALLCIINVIRELVVFRHRFGLGGLLVFGGTLVWWCHDYFSRWFGNAHGMLGINSSAPIVAKAAFMTCLFTLMMSVGLLIPFGRRAEKVIVSIPEPTSSSFYFFLIVVLFCIGISPYFIFTNQPFYKVIFNEMTAMRSSHQSMWTVGRTGNMNYTWGAYVIHIIQIGWFGGILAAFYAIMIGRSLFLKAVCWAIWLFWVLLAIGSGTRGYVVFFTLPVIVLVFIKTEIRAARTGGINVLGYGIGAAVLFLVLVAIQFQGTFRNTREAYRDIAKLDLTKNQGNHMFTEGLLAYTLVPKVLPFTKDTFPGASIVRPLPDVVIRFATGWIPRALWTNKPGFDDWALLYNKMMSGGTAANTGGATICLSVSTGAYVYYGIPGVIQTGLLYGWLCVLVERGFRRANLRPAATLFVLGLFQYMFRCYRDLTPHDLYPLLFGAGAMAILVVLSRPLFGSDESAQAQPSAAEPTHDYGAMPAEAYA